jgi:hypothetical protein
MLHQRRFGCSITLPVCKSVAGLPSANDPAFRQKKFQEILVTMAIVKTPLNLPLQTGKIWGLEF